MEKINTDCKWRIWKIEAKLFNMRKPWLSSFKQLAYQLQSIAPNYIDKTKCVSLSKFDTGTQELGKHETGGAGKKEGGGGG